MYSTYKFIVVYKTCQFQYLLLFLDLLTWENIAGISMINNIYISKTFSH